MFFALECADTEGGGSGITDVSSSHSSPAQNFDGLK